MPQRAPSHDPLTEQLYRHELGQFQSKVAHLEGLRFRVENSERIRSLHQSQAFIDMLKALKQKADTRAEKLMTQRHDDYEQGKTQGYIEALTEFILVKPMDLGETEDAVTEIARLTAELREKQRLLDFVPEVRDYIL